MHPKKSDDLKEDKKKRILGHNIDELEKENKPKEMQAVFKGAEQEKVKAIKGKGSEQNRNRK